jgi:hypothetical protein
VIQLDDEAFGLDGKTFRVLEATSSDPGRWDLELVEYDARVYSDEIQDEDPDNDTTLPEHRPTNWPGVD